MKEQKEVLWIGSSKVDLDTFPKPVKRHVGYALNYSQHGDKHPDAKALSGFGSAQVQEIVSTDRSGTYRSVYTVQFENYIYVLHCFQKKSTTGIKTSKQDLDLIKKRLYAAEIDFKARKEEG